jgi:putative phosphoesterase
MRSEEGPGYPDQVRVAALYDIHGNAPALRASLVDAIDLGVDAIVVGGDVVEGPQPVKTLQLLDAVEIPLLWVRGNCDRAPSEWVTERLDAWRVEWLKAFPQTQTLDIESLGAVCFCHGSPHSDEDIVTAVSDVERVAPMLEGVEERTVVSGHTHVQFDRTVAGHRLINAGSVGMAYQGVAGHAFWSVFGPNVEHRSSRFDAAEFSAILESCGYPHPEWFDVESAETAAEAYEQMARDQATSG